MKYDKRQSIPQWDHYAGPNSMRIDVRDETYWYSYKTLVAFKTWGTPLVILKNYWSATTGKHLNAINTDKKLRVDQKTFDTLLEELGGKTC